MIGEAIHAVRKGHAMKAPHVFLLNLLVGGFALSFVGPADGDPREPPSALPPAQLVTIDGEKTLSEALTEFRKQTGIVVFDKHGEDDPRLKLNLKQVPSWKALDTIAAESGTRLFLSPRDGRVGLDKRTVKTTQPVCYAGPYRIALQRLTAQRDFDTDRRACLATLDVSWEPQAPPLWLETRPAKIVARGNDTNELTALAEGGDLKAVDGRYGYSFEVHLPPVPRTTQDWKFIRGQLAVIGPTKVIPFTFGPLDALAKAAPDAPLRTQNKDGITCRISSIQLQGDRWVVEVLVDNPPGSAMLDTSQIWVANNELALVSRDGGKKLVSSEWVLGNDPSRKAKVTYEFRDRGETRRGDPANWTLTYRTPADLKVMALPFEFKDVPLP
jgi:hypothetical protein